MSQVSSAVDVVATIRLRLSQEDAAQVKSSLETALRADPVRIDFDAGIVSSRFSEAVKAGAASVAPQLAESISQSVSSGVNQGMTVAGAAMRERAFAQAENLSGIMGMKGGTNQEILAEASSLSAFGGNGFGTAESMMLGIRNQAAAGGGGAGGLAKMMRPFLVLAALREVGGLVGGEMDRRQADIAFGCTGGTYPDAPI
jgi:hypothetical protein